METGRRKKIRSLHCAVWGLALLCGGCFSKSAVMTRQNFDEIQVGSSVKQIETQVGKPFAVYGHGTGAWEYEYIERISMGEEVIEENHYFLIVKDGKVVSKRLNTEHPPAYDEIYEADPNDTDLQ